MVSKSYSRTLITWMVSKRDEQTHHLHLVKSLIMDLMLLHST